MFKGKLLPPVISPTTHNVIAQIEITEGNYLEWYDRQKKETIFEIIAKAFRRHRSKDANAYFHVLCGKIADVIGSSKPEIKNLMISRYGQPEIIDGIKEYIIVREDRDVSKLDELHLSPTAQTQELNGVMYRVYTVMRGSHDYNTKEMSILIDGVISEAREVGIPEAEIVSRKDAEMLQLYGIKL